MPCKVTDRDTEQYRTHGYVVFRQILPPTLIQDLRRECDLARELARRTDPDAQRLQPIASHAELNVSRFQDVVDLPDLVDALHRLVAPDAWLGGVTRMGVLFEPSQRPWATTWHRDFGPFQQRVDLPAYRKVRFDPRYFHQINCALYAEGCTWYVPGSHARDDTPEEKHLTRDFPWKVGHDQKHMNACEVEHYCAAYVRSMPGAIQLYLDAGDLALYRNHGYHIGNYVTSQRRATLHDSVWTREWKASFDRWSKGETFTETTDAMLV